MSGAAMYELVSDNYWWIVTCIVYCATKGNILLSEQCLLRHAHIQLCFDDAIYICRYYF